MTRLLTYDYECEACGHKFTHIQENPDYYKKQCPECNKKKLRRLFPRPAFHSHYSPMHPRVNRGRGY